MSNTRIALLAAFTAIIVSALFLILVGMAPEKTCEEWGHTPVVLEEGAGVVCIPWEDVVLGD